MKILRSFEESVLVEGASPLHAQLFATRQGLSLNLQGLKKLSLVDAALLEKTWVFKQSDPSGKNCDNRKFISIPIKIYLII